MVEVHKVSGAAFDGNVYLVLDEKPILVDAGMMAGPTLKNIKKFIDPAKIELIVLTHCHHDHSGAAPALKEATGARLMLSEKEVGCIGDELASVAYLFGQQAPEYKVDETLKEGMVLDIGEWKLEVMETPGHSTGSLCLYERTEKVLFSGDTVFPDGNIGRTDMFGGSTDELVRSIQRLTELDVKVMYPGHMDITSQNVNRQIQMSLRFAKSI
ncbi:MULTISPECIES: MBL fold metallo-hydrolase [Methanothrix]|jgi:Zn-dependent hydrolases, including glyoxylases|uniref:Metallo-beta-lactamase domain protein n=1 Tax=Methanothrix soehngenii (strain ATCC 5969 / DSM 3671 / JCM 10134 / NBRC 103675 / OCM 69 / GP-6) TaxID=990316 RepID=F4BU43_METSG|nr:MULTISPECIES: MBL fold metallo-hydrolase [Methanothrix]AEB68241.1 metallo-beta-lactamase domain protein [Methanothrix soehngenii GP6]HPY93050.1 MBL fold metallo-hydrolase [Methanothrix soehngenii]